ncbi:MAG: radical SAM protein, partial [Phycisphaerales bacterium]
MRPEAISSTLKKMINHKHLRKLLTKRVDDYIYKKIVVDDSEDLQSVQIKRYQFLSAMLRCMVRNVNKGYVSSEIVEKIIDVFVQNNLIRKDHSYNRAVEKYKEKYGEPPPTFIVFSPTQKCNLKCVGCYAASGTDTAATIPYPIVDRIIREVHDIFGGRFVTISGGEP